MTRPLSSARPQSGIVLDPPPAWLSRISDDAIKPVTSRARHASYRILLALYELGITARPTLAEVEAERARRGMRPGVGVAAAARSARVVIPMPEPSAAPALAALARGREAVASARARFDGASLSDVVGYQMGLVYAERKARAQEAREEARADRAA